MNPRVKAVRPNPDYTLTLLFTNGETKSFDVRPYLDKGIFRELQDLRNFNSVKPFLGSVQWHNGQDFCPDTLYMDSVAVSASEGHQYATIKLEGEDYRVYDLGSGNGTFVQDQRVRDPIVLQDGVIVRFGEVEFVFKRVSLG